MVRLGINGFGRIGRMVLRATIYKISGKCPPCPDNPFVVAINDPNMCPEHMAYLLKHDTAHGPFDADVSVVGKGLKINGQIVEVSNERDPSRVPWEKSCTAYVIEASGVNTSCEMASKHKSKGVKRILVAAPSPDAPVFIVGVNHDSFNPQSMDVVSVSSASTNCIAPILRVLKENYGVLEVMVNVVQAAKPYQKVQDGAKKYWTVGRSALSNIISSESSSTRDLVRVFEDLEKKVMGIASRVPLTIGLMADVTVRVCKGTTYEKLKCKIKDASQTYMKDIICYSDERLVSSDIINNPNSCVFDARSSFGLNKNAFKLIGWCDNEWAFANRVVEMSKYMGSREACGAESCGEGGAAAETKSCPNKK